jgi:anthranilate synthase component 2
MRLFLLDNYDSFTFNLAHLFGELGVEVVVRRHDALDVDDVAFLDPDLICISPGPRTPAHSGISKDLVRRFAGVVPILGVCLGMQVINEVYGGRTVKAPYPVHGKRSKVIHNGEGIFKGVPSPFMAARYHSLSIETGSEELEILALSEDEVVMGIRHRQLQVHGVQFHPESFLGEHGRLMAENFLEEAG